jgi:hypothetical protein
MTQAQLDGAIAGATGESLRTIHHLGFSVLGNEPHDLETDDPVLVLDCPFCGHAVPYPGRGRDGLAALAECLRCDVYFDAEEAEVYATDPIRP